MASELYIVKYPWKTEYAEGDVDNAEFDDDKILRCPLCGRYISASYWKHPREVALTKRNLPDFLYADFSHPFLLSEHALEVIRQAGLTGIVNAEEIEHTRFKRKGKKEVPIPKYYYIELARSSMTVNHEKSVIVYGSQGEGNYAEPCPLCRPVPGTYDFIRHLEFNMEQYEGYDIFFTYELGGEAILSKRFVDVCQANGLTNLHYRPAAKTGAKEAAYFLDGVESDDEED